MKIKCDFCKTEYNVDNVPATTVRCPICGHCWLVQMPARKNTWLIFIASVCALLAAIVFAIAVISQYNVMQQKRRPLVATIIASEIINDEKGVPHFRVHGTVRNQSAEIYGVPDLIIIGYDAKGDVVLEQKFPPSGTLIDSGGLVNFTHVLSGNISGVKKISAKLEGLK